MLWRLSSRFEESVTEGDELSEKEVDHHLGVLAAVGRPSPRSLAPAFFVLS
jgi:hypothetical protein